VTYNFNCGNETEGLHSSQGHEKSRKLYKIFSPQINNRKMCGLSNSGISSDRK